MKIKSTKMYSLGGFQYTLKIVWELWDEKQKYIFIDYRNWEDDRVDCWVEYPEGASYDILDEISELTEDEDYSEYGDYLDKRYDKTSSIEDFEDCIDEDMAYEIEDGLRDW